MDYFLDPAPYRGTGRIFFSNIRDILYKDAHKHCWYLWLLYFIQLSRFCIA